MSVEELKTELLQLQNKFQEVENEMLDEIALDEYTDIKRVDTLQDVLDGIDLAMDLIQEKIRTGGTD